MSLNRQEQTGTEAVGVFADAAGLQAAIDELTSSGFDRADLSLLAGEEAVKEKLGAIYRKVEDLEDDPTTPRMAFVSEESIGDAQGGLMGGLAYIGAVAAGGAIVASGGTLLGAAVAAALAGCAGGAIGSALAKLVGDRHSRHLQEQLEHGGLLLWVRTWTKDQETKAVSILSRHSAHDVHTHEIAPTQV